MNQTLSPVTIDNYEDICDLNVRPDQEDHLSSNAFSLVEASFYPDLTARAIYRDETPVGFIMWDQENPKVVTILRFMVDAQFQGQGFGRGGLSLALEAISNDKRVEEIVICYHPDNPVPKDFYAGFGFEEIGMDEDDDDMLARVRVGHIKTPA